MNTTTKAQRTNKRQDAIWEKAKRASEMTDEEHEQLDARRKHGAKGTAYLPPADKSVHTPGPWKIDENEQLPLAVIKDDEDGEGICEIGKPDSNAYSATPEQWVNARLIAAAPDYHDKAHKLAMRILQSDFYRYAKQEVDDVLDVWRKVEGISCA